MNNCGGALKYLIDVGLNKLLCSLVALHNPVRPVLKKRVNLLAGHLAEPAAAAAATTTTTTVPSREQCEGVRRAVGVGVAEGGGGLLELCEDGLVEAELAGCCVEHILLVCPVSDEAVHLNVLLLSDAVAACLCLHIVLWVPIAIKNDNGISDLKIDAEATGTRAKEEDETIRAGPAEAVYCGLAVSTADPSVEALEGVAAVREVILEDVEDADHLGEDEDLMAVGLEPGEELIDEDKLSGGRDELAVDVGL